MKYTCDNCRNWVEGPMHSFRYVPNKDLCGSCASEVAEVISGRDCDWCREPAIDGERVRETAVHVYWCGDHEDIGHRSATGGRPASKGSLHSQIRRGKLGNAEEALA